MAARHGRGPSIAAAIASVLVFDFFFVPPYLQFAVSDIHYLVTFGVMLIIGLVISTLTTRFKGQLAAAQQLQNRTDALYRLTKQLSELSGWEFLIRHAGQQLGTIFDGEVVLFVREREPSLQLRFGESTSVAKMEINSIVAQWVADHDQVAGAGTDTLPNATALFAPLVGSQSTLGAVGVRPNDPERFFDPDQRRMFETCASLIALSLERDRSVLEASDAQLRVQTEEMRSSLLSSVSARSAHAAGRHRRGQREPAQESAESIRRIAAGALANDRRRIQAPGTARRESARHDAARIGGRRAEQRVACSGRDCRHGSQLVAE